ncbi:MAG: HAD hydrolase-like protein [Mobiluncus sp.]|uniref:HAD family hydrolase n=1 Tax=Mobiluncus sp. TaxID=47293 RepID=UPI002590CF03|nr:HAD hydrolase-like protein [Mobiluncus sp.]MCI6584036.1 HAD hydrolase-like protein [Mobiluncus sp.]
MNVQQEASLRPEAVIFDLDGTLVNSAPLVMECFRLMVRDLFGSEREAELTDVRLLTYLGPPLMDSMYDIDPAASEEKAAAMVAKYREYYLPRAEESPLFEGIPELLESLKGRGIRLAVATSKLEKPARKILDHHGVLEAFETVGGASSDLRLSTKAEVLEETLARLGLGETPERALMIGDRFYDIEGAAACGVPAVLVTWGKTAGQGEEQGAVAVVGTTEELSELLSEQ